MEQATSKRFDRTGRALSGREREVLLLLADGLTGPEIAERLRISTETVRTHLQNVLRKLNARTRCHAIAIAMQDAAFEPSREAASSRR